MGQGGRMRALRVGGIRDKRTAVRVGLLTDTI